MPSRKDSVKNGESVFADGKDEANVDSKVSGLEAGVSKKRGRDETEEIDDETGDKEASSAKRIKTEEQKTYEHEVSESSGLGGQQKSPAADPIPSSPAAAELEKDNKTAGRKRPREETDEGTDQDEEDEKGAKTARLDSTLSEVTSKTIRTGGFKELDCVVLSMSDIRSESTLFLMIVARFPFKEHECVIAVFDATVP